MHKQNDFNMSLFYVYFMCIVMKNKKASTEDEIRNTILAIQQTSTLQVTNWLVELSIMHIFIFDFLMILKTKKLKIASTHFKIMMLVLK